MKKAIRTGLAVAGVVIACLAISGFVLWTKECRSWHAYNEYMVRGEVAEKDGRLADAYRFYRSAGIAEDWQNTFHGTFDGRWQCALENVVSLMLRSGDGDVVADILRHEGWRTARNATIGVVGCDGGEAEISLLTGLAARTGRGDIETEAILCTALEKLTGAATIDYAVYPVAHGRATDGMSGRVGSIVSWIREQREPWSVVVPRQIDAAMAKLPSTHGDARARIFLFLDRQLSHVYPTTDDLAVGRTDAQAWEDDVLVRRLCTWWEKERHGVIWDGRKGHMVRVDVGAQDKVGSSEAEKKRKDKAMDDRKREERGLK